MLKKCKKENVGANEVGAHREWVGMGWKEGEPRDWVGGEGTGTSLSLLLNGAQTLRTPR